MWKTEGELRTLGSYVTAADPTKFEGKWVQHPNEWSTTARTVASTHHAVTHVSGCARSGYTKSKTSRQSVTDRPHTDP